MPLLRLCMSKKRAPKKKRRRYPSACTDQALENSHAEFDLDDVVYGVVANRLSISKDEHAKSSIRFLLKDKMRRVLTDRGARSKHEQLQTCFSAAYPANMGYFWVALNRHRTLRLLIEMDAPWAAALQQSRILRYEARRDECGGVVILIDLKTRTSLSASSHLW
ncbi:hypothetical protein BDZ91DRAFT_851059 [Kalaharituber pfeilii]|nr:hypothetical protein BDZ91DRAFT_851059 [Kalaharituber pfeilii]